MTGAGAGAEAGWARWALLGRLGREAVAETLDERLDKAVLELLTRELLGAVRGRTPELPRQTVQGQPMLLPLLFMRYSK
jgi:hypothetical protein